MALTLKCEVFVFFLFPVKLFFFKFTNVILILRFYGTYVIYPDQQYMFDFLYILILL